MFKYSFFCQTDWDIKPTPDIFSYTENGLESYTLEPCKLGKNLNLKYKDLIENIKKVEGYELEDFYCINFNGSNLTLYSHPSLGYKYENHLVFQLLADCDDYFVNLKVISENDFIDHSNKDNPIVPYYQKKGI